MGLISMDFSGIISGIQSGIQNKGARIQSQEKKLLHYYGKAVKNQTKATTTAMKVAGKQKTALQVGSEQASYRIQKQLSKYGTTSNEAAQKAATGPAPRIKAQDKIDMGVSGLKSTPEAYKAYYLSKKSSNTLQKASKLEDRILKARTQQALNQGQQSPEPLPKLIKPDMGSHILHSPRFKGALENRYGGQTKTAAKTTQSENRPPQNHPEDLSWMDGVEHRAIGWRQVAQLNDVNGGRS